ncbi:hypothetical protein E2C01_048756 [Portunus trituberculatus]|uniref:Uncharacterized protein n=1 Tax=Portunus trituberculatus TaxID=210409 RepID=A0A5B7GB08_PORTR|nr:hypothetical protein [Portunus trituberculatus]
MNSWPLIAFTHSRVTRSVITLTPNTTGLPAIQPTACCQPASQAWAPQYPERGRSASVFKVSVDQCFSSNRGFKALPQECCDKIQRQTL